MILGEWFFVIPLVFGFMLVMVVLAWWECRGEGREWVEKEEEE